MFQISIEGIWSIVWGLSPQKPPLPPWRRDCSSAHDHRHIALKPRFRPSRYFDEMLRSVKMSKRSPSSKLNRNPVCRSEIQAKSEWALGRRASTSQTSRVSDIDGHGGALRFVLRPQLALMSLMFSISFFSFRQPAEKNLKLSTGSVGVRARTFLNRFRLAHSATGAGARDQGRMSDYFNVSFAVCLLEGPSHLQLRRWFPLLGAEVTSGQITLFASSAMLWRQPGGAIYLLDNVSPPLINLVLLWDVFGKIHESAKHVYCWKQLVRCSHSSWARGRQTFWRRTTQAITQQFEGRTSYVMWLFQDMLHSTVLINQQIFGK